MTHSLISREWTAILNQFSNGFHLNEPPSYMQIESLTILFKSKIQVRTAVAAILQLIFYRSFFFWYSFNNYAFSWWKRTQLHTHTICKNVWFHINQNIKVVFCSRFCIRRDSKHSKKPHDQKLCIQYFDEEKRVANANIATVPLTSLFSGIEIRHWRQIHFRFNRIREFWFPLIVNRNELNTF